MSALLPQSHAQFSDKAYWDDFFAKMKKEAFEWYGGFEEIHGHFLSIGIPTSARILVIGCGNSNLSSDLFDAGYRDVTSVDFSADVIAEMVEKNRQTRPAMRWEVADMTNMTGVADGSFDVVLDKGALDALMSTDSTAAQLQAIRMFNEIGRVLRAQVPSASASASASAPPVYLCVSLAESYILRSLLGYFRDTSCGQWVVDMRLLADGSAPAADKGKGKGKPKQPQLMVPFIIAVSKAEGRGQILRLHSDIFFNPLPQDRAATFQSTEDALRRVDEMQRYHERAHRLTRLHVGRSEVVEFHAAPDSGVSSKVPRFTVTIVDYTEWAARSCAVFVIPAGRETERQFATEEGLQEIAQSAQCCRLLAVRCNKPHRFSAAMETLQAELNPMLTTLFPAPGSNKSAGSDDSEPVPYMGLESDFSWEEIHRGCSAVSGDYIVEEKVEERALGSTDGAADGHIASKQRRLIFLQNQNFVQTEVTLVPVMVAAPAEAGEATEAGRPKQKGTKCKGVKAAGAPMVRQWRVSPAHLDAHHAAVLLAVAFASTNLGHLQTNRGNRASMAAGGKKKPVVKGAEDPADSIVGRGAQGKDAPAGSGPNVLIVGLGGGSMPTALFSFLPRGRVYTCEWDEEVIRVARDYFGYQDVTTDAATGGLRTICGDGDEVLRKLSSVQSDTASSSSSATSAPALAESVASDAALNHLLSSPVDVIFVDVDCKDVGTASITAPPPVFIAPEALGRYRDVLLRSSSRQTGSRSGGKPVSRGLLAINVVCRNDASLDGLLGDLLDTFKYPQGAAPEFTASIYVLRPSDEDINLILFVVLEDAFTGPTAAGGGEKAPWTPVRVPLNAEKRLRVLRTTHLLLQCTPKQAGDPLQLLEKLSSANCAANLQEII